ncbi:MAG: hypothetical protein ACPLRH_01845 [Desulfotomaculales bacterium]
MGTKLFALLIDGKANVERLAEALLDAAAWHVLCFGRKPEFSVTGNPRFPFDLFMRFTAPHPEAGIRLVYPISILVIRHWWTGQLGIFAVRASQLIPDAKIAHVVYISTVSYGKITVYQGGRPLEESKDMPEHIANFKRVLKKYFGITWPELEDWHYDAYVYSNFGPYARQKRCLAPVFEDEAEAVEAYRAGKTEDGWPFKTPWAWTKGQSEVWEKADSGRYNSRMFALVDGYPSLEILPVPKELTPEEWFRYKDAVE